MTNNVKTGHSSVFTVLNTSTNVFYVEGHYEYSVLHVSWHKQWKKGS